MVGQVKPILLSLVVWEHVLASAVGMIPAPVLTHILICRGPEGLGGLRGAKQNCLSVGLLADAVHTKPLSAGDLWQAGGPCKLWRQKGGI